MAAPAAAAGALLTALLLAAVPGARSQAKLPDTMPTCKKNDPQLNDCLKTAIQNSIPDLVKGIPSLKMPPMDPLRIEHMSLAHGQGSINLDLELSDFDMTGLGNSMIDSVEADLSKPDLKIVAHASRGSIEGPYKVDGKVMLLPITGSGHANFTFVDWKIALMLSGGFKEKSGHRYFDMHDFKVTMNPGHMHIMLDNLFNGDAAMGQTMNAFLNENSAELQSELLPSIEQTFSAAWQHLAERLFKKVPFDEIFRE